MKNSWKNTSQFFSLRPSFWCILLIVAPFVRGQGTFVSPQQLSTVAGNAGGFIGLQSFQQIYAGSQFSSSIHNPIFIMAFSYRIDETFPAALSAVIPKLEIIMSTSLRPITQMIANRALNRGPIQQVVFSHENFPVRACFKNRLEGDCERGGADGEARRGSILEEICD
jgi:hypothetical protein